MTVAFSVSTRCLGLRTLELVLDLELISQRIMQVAQAAVEEHVASIGRSQADRLMELAAETQRPETALEYPQPHPNRMRF